MSLPTTDRTKLNNLSPNLVPQQIAVSALRLAVFQEIYTYLDNIITDLNAAQATGAVTTPKLADGGVSTVKLADNAVTGAKLLDSAVIASKLADGSVTTTKVGDGAVVTIKLADGAVVSAKIADLNVTSGKIADNAVISVKLADGAVLSAKIADGAVTNVKIADGGVTGAKIADNTITTQKLVDSIITAAKILDGSVTNAKLAPGSVTGDKVASGAINSQHMDAALLASAASLSVQSEFDKRGVNVQKYGAKGDGSTDDTAAIQAAFDYVKQQVLSGNRVEIFFPPGEYKITAPLIFNFHFGCILRGAATITVSNAISESAPIDCMLDMAEFATVNQYRTGSLVIRDLKFNANNRANKVIEAIGDSGYGMYYTTLDRCEFKGLKKGGIGINGISWATNVSNCKFAGYGQDNSIPENWCGLGIKIGNSPNGVLIRGNDFTRLEKGVSVASYGKVSIIGNVFDTTRQSAITAIGSRGLTISDNYFEAICTDGETVKVYQNVDVSNVKAVIVVIGHYSDWTGHAAGIDIKDNVFANCHSDDLIVCDMVIGMSVTGNTIHSKNDSPHNSLVKFLKYGIGYVKRSGQLGLYVERNSLEQYNTTYPSGRMMVNQIVDYSLLVNSGTIDFLNGGYTNKIVIKDMPLIDDMGKMKKLPRNLYESNFYNDRANTDFFTIQPEKINGETVYGFIRTATSTLNNFIKINNKYLGRLKGNTVRVSFQVANTQSGAGIRFSMKDGVKTTLYLPTGNQLDKTQTDAYNEIDFIFTVDKNATELSFLVSSFCSAGQTIYIKNFSITPAAYDLAEFSDMNHTLYGSSAPNSGSWTAGDYVINSTPSQIGTSPNKYILSGWLRLTTGSGNVLNTDWVEDRRPTGN